MTEASDTEASQAALDLSHIQKERDRNTDRQTDPDRHRDIHTNKLKQGVTIMGHNSTRLPWSVSRPRSRPARRQRYRRRQTTTDASEQTILAH